jgi:hypothetical protein
MDQFEKFINDQRDKIQDDFPTEGHFERFEMKLSGSKPKKSNYWIGFASGIAAIFVIGLLAFFYTVRPEKGHLTLSDLSEQYADVEFYYTSSIKQQTKKLEEICEKYGKDDKALQSLYHEINEYDQTYAQICKELDAAPNDERVINALITYYRTKLEIINKILSEIESKQKENESHEDINI